MAQSFYFYDTETSGTWPSRDRIMQFAGIRTTLDLQEIGEPDDLLIALTPDVLPEPDAVLVHGVTPQLTIQEGVTEAEFCKYFQENIATADTIFVGFNSVRFDDEFVRYTLYRNFYEPYEWQWKDGRSRWDILDALRMMRALRPEGITWPFDGENRPTVRLELLTKANNLLHDNAHTALADVRATIAVAKLMQQSQPKLFEFLLRLRSKKEVQKIVESAQPFLYTSGKYSGDFLKTTVIAQLLKHPKRDAAIVYDLRFDPTPLFKLSVDELAQRWKAKRGDDVERLPVKTLQYNRCPAVAPLGVLDAQSQKRLGIDMSLIRNNYHMLKNEPEFLTRLGKALGILEEKQAQLALQTEAPVDEQLYSSFWNEQDKRILHMVHEHAPATLAELMPKITNARLHKLLPLYKARNYSNLLTPEERDAYEVYRQDVLLAGGEQSRLAKFFKRLEELSKIRLTTRDQYLLTELQLYAESIAPYSAD